MKQRNSALWETDLGAGRDTHGEGIRKEISAGKGYSQRSQDQNNAAGA